MTETLFGDDDCTKPQPKPKKLSRVVVRPIWCDAIYRAYPRKVGVTYAIKAIHNKIKDLAIARYERDASKAYKFLLERTKAFALSQDGHTNRSFIPYPATWFNQGRFNDDPNEWNQWRGPEWYDDQKRKQAAKARSQEVKAKWKGHIAAMSKEDLANLKEAVAIRLRRMLKKAHRNDLNFSRLQEAVISLDVEGVILPGPFDRIARSIEGFSD